MTESMDSIPEEAHELHQRLTTAQDSSHKYSQTELQDLSSAKSPDALMSIVQILMNHHLLKAVHVGKELRFEVVSSDEADKVSSMSGDEAIVYSCIQASGREGVWTKTIKAKTNLHQTVLMRCLKSLESQRHIKAVKSVKYPTRKIFMLAALEPSIEVTGGPWFTDSELDSEFIDNLLNVVWRYAVSLSFPRAFQSTSSNGADPLKSQESYPATYDGYPTLQEIHKFIVDSGITNVNLAVTDVRALCEVLVYDDKLERRDQGYRYKATWHSVVAAGGASYTDAEDDMGQRLDALNESSCGRCPVFDICAPEGPVNSDECVYLDEWLEGV